MAVETTLSVKIKTWRNSLFNSKRALFLCLGILALSFSVTVYSFWARTYKVTVTNGTVKTSCVSNYLYDIQKDVIRSTYSLFKAN